jgi:hypothetical protein
MQKATEKALGNLTGYLAGQTPLLEPRLDFADDLSPELLADRIVNTIQAAAITSGRVALNVAGSDSFQELGLLDSGAVEDYIAQLRSGALVDLPPSVIQTPLTEMTLEQRQKLEAELLQLPEVQANEQARLQIQGALAANDLAGAMTLASRSVLRDRVVQGLERWEAQLAESDGLNGLVSSAQLLGQKESDLINGLTLVRSYATFVRNLMIPLVLLMAILLAAIAWINRHSARSVLKSIGWTLAIGGGIVLLMWVAAGLFLRSYLGPIIAAQPLPAGADLLLDDLVGNLASAVWRSVWDIALFWFVIGLVALIVAYAKPLLHALQNLLAPLWPYRVLVGGLLFGVFVLIPLLVRIVETPVRAANLPCNGHVELCDRPLNEVVFATTHNSMSISQYGWLWPSHDGTIADQLAAGVRALLVDTHYWDTKAKVENTLAELSPELRPVAEKAFASLGIQDRDGAFFCHMACGLGSTAIEQTLADIRTFLEENPREVLIVVIQDAISPVDTEQAFAEAGLDRYLFTHRPGEAWPTLRQMIEADQRLVVMAEENGPPPDWYQNVWDNTMETPYTFINYDDFSCAVNRGDTGKPFFLLNHWIQRGSPNRVDASIVNEYEFLLTPARQCAEERGKIPNFIAVNFYQNGDVFRVVDELNGVASAQE